MVDPKIAQDDALKAVHRLVSVTGTSGAAVAYDYKPCQSIAVREVAIGARRDCRCVVRRDSLLFVGVNGGIAVVDITDPRIAQIVGGIVMQGTEIVDFALVGNTLFAADFLNGVHAIDVSDPKLPRHLALHPALSHSNNRRVVTSGELLVLVNDHALSVFDIAKPGVLRPLSLQHRLRSAVGWLRGVAFEGTRLHVTQGPMGLWTFDLADPAMPRTLSGIEPRLDSRPNERLIADSLALHDNRLFVGTSSGIWTLTLPPSGAPESERFYTGPGTIREATATARDGQLYFIALEPHDHVFHIFDLAEGVRYMGRQRLSRMIDRLYDVEHGNGFWIAAAGNAGVLFASY